VRRAWFAIAAAAALVGIVCAVPRDRSLSCPAGPIRSDGIGNITLGMTVDSLRSICAVAQDTMEMAEGQPARHIFVMIGRDTVDAELSRRLVNRITIRSPAFMTADSLRIGSPVARVFSRPGAALLTGEGQSFVVEPSHCGLSFRKSGDMIDRILIVGCLPRLRP